jgi:hypothetical protein
MIDMGHSPMGTIRVQNFIGDLTGCAHLHDVCLPHSKQLVAPACAHHHVYASDDDCDASIFEEVSRRANQKRGLQTFDDTFPRSTEYKKQRTPITIPSEPIRWPYNVKQRVNASQYGQGICR